MGEDQTSEGQFARLAERLDRLEAALREQTVRLHALERQIGGARQPAAPPPPERPAPPRPARADLEARIGGNWFNLIGVLAIILGSGFFLKYAFDNEWIGPRGRILIGVMLGLGLLGGGDRLRARGYRRYAQGLSGGGIGILYLAIYAAFAFYQLIGRPPAFLCMVAVTVASVLLAARYDALPMAVLGALGGFLTPVVLATGEPNRAGLFGYLVLLDLGVLGLAYFKQWRGLNYLAFAATAMLFATGIYSPDEVGTSLGFMTAFFLLFALLAVMHNVLRRSPTRWLDAGLAGLNAALYFAAGYALLEARHGAWLGLFALLLAAFYLGCGYLASLRQSEDRSLAGIFFGLGAALVAFAVGIQFERQWVTMGWAAEAVLLTWVGLGWKSRAARAGALVLFAVAALHWLGVEGREVGQGADFRPLLNWRAGAGAWLIGALGLAARLYERAGARVVGRERKLAGAACALAANLVAVVLLSLDVSDYFDRAKAQESENIKQLTLSALWGLYGGGVLLAGLRRGRKLLRVLALALLGVTIIKVFVVDLAGLDRIYRIVSFIILGAILLTVSFLYQRAQRRAEEGER
ncbi:MAG TPA: DUF2339 domain-containing protein [Blastocatellia bacterium]|nr:DUF2339 domain-containing protein [Blastocatellia bacterium]